MNLFPFLRRLPHLRPSLPLFNLTSSFSRLLSTAATTETPPPNPHFAAIDYLIQSCGLPSDKAIQASKRIQHLKSPDKPDAVLRFLRQIGVSESDIRTAVPREPRILVSHVEKNWRPNVAKLQEIGLSIEDISGIISRRPGMFCSNIVQKIDFWLRALGSLENMSLLLKKGPVILSYNMEKVIVPNLLFLQNQCGLSVCQILQLIKSGSRFIGLRPEAMKVMVKRAEELGFSCSSRMFVYALITVASVNKNILNSRVHYLKTMGFSQEEVTYMISKAPLVLQKIDFWMSFLGSVENMSVLLKRGASMLNCSLEKVIVPNLSFLQNQCGLSVCQIVQLIRSGSRLIKSRPEAMKVMVKRAEELGFSCSSQMFVYALITVASVNKNTLNSRVHYLKSMGFSQEEVTHMMSKLHTVFKLSKELLGLKMEFLIKDAGCSKIDVVRNPVLLGLSLEKRLIPRNLVRKLLKSKEFPVANKAFASFFQPSEKDFLEKFVIPYEHDIPGLGQAYADAYSGNTGANK